MGRTHDSDAVSGAAMGGGQDFGRVGVEAAVVDVLEIANQQSSDSVKVRAKKAKCNCPVSPVSLRDGPKMVPWS